LDETKIIAIVIGIIGALIGVYFREAIRNAKLKLQTAVRLDVNIRHLLSTGLENKSYEDLFITGFAISTKEREALRTGNYEKISQLRNDINEKVPELVKKNIENKPEIIDEIIKKVMSFSKQEIEEIIKEIDRKIEMLFNDNGFISDKEASKLDYHILPKIYEMRNSIYELYVIIKLLLSHLSTNPNLDKERLTQSIIQCVINGIKVTKNIHPILDYTNKVRSKEIFGNLI